MRTVERRLHLRIGQIERWADLAGYWFSEGKTVAVYFCCQRLFVAVRRIDVMDESIFLGIVWDSCIT